MSAELVEHCSARADLLADPPADLPVQRGTGPSMGDLAEPAVVVPHDVPAAAVDALFRRDDDLRAVVLTGGAQPVLVDRAWFERMTTGPVGYARLLHGRRAVRQVTPPASLVFDADEPVTRAAAAIIGRSGPSATFDSVVVLDADGGIGVAVVAVVLERLARSYAHQSVHDPLTGLPNRTLLMRRLAAASTSGRTCALLYVDLDRFKDVNDAHGHDAGDQVLVQFAERLRGVCRGEDLVARLGGDEFAVLVEGRQPVSTAESMAERVVHEAAAPFVVHVRGAEVATVSLGASVGVATTDDQGGCPAAAGEPAAGELQPGQQPGDPEVADVVLRHADAAMHQAKAHGRGRVARFDAAAGEGATTAELQGRRAMERKLRTAIRDRSLTLHYQPIAELPDGLVTSAEALARWYDEELGSVPPDQFIPLAEQTGLIIDLGRWVLRTACAEAATWVAPDGRRTSAVSVNVSPVQLAAAGFVDDVRTVLAQTALAPNRLCLEVTETAVIADLDHTARVLGALRDLGVQLALDDFGTGHSSLTLLQRLPVDVVKIDRSFVRDVTRSAQDAVLVRLVVDAAHSFGRRVCAEGVEDEEQARQLAAMGCDCAQGWYIGMPEPGGARLRATVTSGALAQPLDVASPAPLVLGGADELVLMTGADRLISYASGTSTTILGRSPRQLLGTPIVELLHPDDHATLAQLDADSAEGGSVTRTHRVVHADGLVRWMTTTTQYHLGGVHGGIEVLTVGRDVTDVVGLRDALVDSEERFRRAFDDAPIGMAITTFSGQFVRVNRAFAAMLGHEPEAMMAMTVVDLTPVQYRALDATNLAALSAGHEQVQDVDKEYLHRNGSRVPVQVRAATMEGPPGRPALIIAHVSPRQS